MIAVLCPGKAMEENKEYHQSSDPVLVPLHGLSRVKEEDRKKRESGGESFYS